MQAKTVSGAAVARHIGMLAAATPIPVAALVVQADALDRINQSAGVATGDAVLAEIARRLENFAADEFGHDCLVARLGGPRFLLVPPAGTAAGALAAQQRALHAVLAQPFIGDPHSRIAIRLALASFTADQPFDRVLMQATSALARPAAKRDGAQVMAAIAGGEVALRYQPQYAMADGHMVGVEALLRWQHPELGLLGAAPLVTAAAAARLECQLTAHAHALAVAEVNGWPAALGDLRVALNITAADLGDTGFSARFAALLDAHGQSATRFTLELTEQAMLANPDSAAEQLATLRALGCRIAVDDFGTGYSSLALLAQLPLDYLKIDSGFVRAMGASDRDRIVVRAIVELARALGLGVIAEGVESEAQRDLLAELGVDYWQGFWGSDVVTGEALAAMA
ncbi:MAG: GGDEF domain-containing protein [Sphingopyxis sp.]|nr:GGDEF domain-containing protein [Sphingopyxis sp.]